MTNHWILALKKWNENKTTFCIPKKGGKEHVEVLKIMNSMKNNNNKQLEKKNNNNKQLEKKKTRKHVKNLLIEVLPIIDKSMDSGGYSSFTIWRLFVSDRDKKDNAPLEIMDYAGNLGVFDLKYKEQNSRGPPKKEIIQFIDEKFTYDKIEISRGSSETGTVFVEKPMYEFGSKNKRF